MFELRALGAHSPANSARVADVPAAGASRWSTLFGEDGLSFGDLVDLVNPLQHIPVVGNLYRRMTGDLIAPGVRIAGGALFGGPVGAMLSAGGLLLEHAGDPAQEMSPAAVPVHAVAATDSIQSYRGGWLVNAAMSGHRGSEIPVVATAARESPATPGIETRRGGWLVAQAYALDDAAVRPPSTVHEKV